MNIIEKLEQVNKTITELIEEINSAEVVVKPEKEKKSNVVPMTRKEKEAQEDIPEELTEESLNALSYNNLKKLAKEMGIPASGSRADLTERILNGPEEVEETEEVVEEAPKKRGRKPLKKEKPVEEEVEDEEVEEVEEEEEEVDPIEEAVNEAVAEMSDEDIMDILTDVGVKARGKRQALISAVVKAVRDGKIDLDDSEEEAEEVEEEEAEETPEVTPERREAVKDFISETDKAVSDGTLTRKDMSDWLNEFSGSNEYSSKKKYSDESILDIYLQAVANSFIDDEGNMVDEESTPYTINQVPFCCGKPLDFNEETEEYHCSVCDSNYSAE